MDINLRITVDESVAVITERLIKALNDVCLGLNGARKSESKPELTDTILLNLEPVDKPTPEVTTEKADEAAAAAYTKDDVVTALQSLAKKKGDKSVSKNLLSKFSASKVSELKEEYYGDLISAAEEMMKNA